MILSVVTRGLACVALVLMGVVPSAAQHSVRFTLGAGATVQHDDTGAADLPGFRVDVGVPLGGHVLAVGDVDVTRQLKKDYYNTNVLGGIRLASGGRVSIFGQFLAGVDRCCGIQALALVPGGGVDVSIGKHLAIRAQVDLPFLRYKGISYRQQFYTIGVAIPFNE